MIRTEEAARGSAERSSPGGSYATRMQRRRQDARERIHARVAHAIDTPHLLPDPLERSDSALRSTLGFARLVIVAALLHGLILTVILLGNALIGKASTEHPPERMQVRIVQVDKKPPPPLPPPEEPPAEERTIPVPVKAPPVETTPKVRPKRPPQAVLPDPVRAPPVEARAAPARRVVGINMASTVEGGQGPAFAVGASRMGETGSHAADPKLAPAQEVPVNRVSTRFADVEAPVVPPRRLAPVAPEYPALLREQGVEADVVVVVSIGADGRVVKVEVVNPAPQAAFNEAAISSAKRERFVPATRGGEAVPYTQRYTIRFRLND